MRTLSILTAFAFAIGCDKQTTVASSQTTSASAAPQLSTAAKPTLVRNESVGPFKLGMTRKEVEALAPITRHPSGQFNGNVRVYGKAYYFVFDGEESPTDKLTNINYSLLEGGGLELDGQHVGVDAGFEKVATLVGKCGTRVDAEGGGYYVCGEHTMVSQSASCASYNDAGACNEFTFKKLDVSVRVVAKVPR